MEEHAKRIRITHLITGTGTGGAEKTLRELVTRLDSGRFISSVISMKSPGRTGEQISKAGISVRSLDLPLETGAGYMAHLFGAAMRLISLLREESPHLLHCWLFQANVLGRAAARIAGVPANLSSLRVMEMEKGFQYPVDGLTSGLVTRYVAVCDAVAGHYREKLHLVPEKISTIPNGIDTGAFVRGERGEARQELGIERDAEVLGFMGRLHGQKGVDVLLGAFREVLAGRPGALLVIAGDGPERSRLEREARETGVAERVVFLGECNDTPLFMSALDAFVLPSRWEGMPNVVLEAMAAGIPVIGTFAGGVPEMVAPEETGLLVAPGDAGALSQAMTRLLSDAGRARAMGEAGRARASELFSMETMVDRYTRLYEELASMP